MEVCRDSTAQLSAATLAVTCTEECMSDKSRPPLGHRDMSRSQAEKEQKYIKKTHTHTGPYVL